MKQTPTEGNSTVFEAPDWLKQFFPDLPGSVVFTQKMIVELEKAHTEMLKAKTDTESLPESVFEELGRKKPTWSQEYMKAKFVSKYVKNFSIRVTKREASMYTESRAAHVKLSTSLGHSRADCADELKEATWGHFYADIDAALVDTGVQIERAQIQTLLASHDADDQEHLQDQINVALFPAVLLLRSKGYALYPDLTL